MSKITFLLRTLVVSAAFVVALAPAATSRPGRSPVAQGGARAAKSRATSDSNPNYNEVAYKIVVSMRVKRLHNKLILWLTTEPENFTRDRMLMLARHLNKDFSGEPRMSAVIFDSEAAARNYDPAGGSYYVSKKLERGEYYLDRTKGRESLNFSSRRGNPVDEIEMSLSDRSTPTKKRKRASR